MRPGPLYLQFYPTLRCNRQCGFCFNRNLPPLPDMLFSTFEKMLERLPESIGTMDIMGGEPTIHPEIAAMTRKAVLSGLRVNLSSNGSALRALEEIGYAGAGITIGISINDHLMLNTLTGFIRRTAVTVKTVHGRDFDAGLAQKILTLAPGRFHLIYRDAMTPEELRETVPFPEFLDAAERLPGARTVFCSGFLPDTAYAPDLAAARCPAGTTKLGVMPDGSVYPCNLFFGRPDFMLGNLLTDPFEQIWRHEKLAFFRTFTSNPCRKSSCPLHERCHGGCPAQRLLLAGDLEAADPRCS